MNEFEKYAVKHVGIGSARLDQFEKGVEKSGILGYNATNSIIGAKNMTGNIIEERKMNIAILSVYDRLLTDRIMFLNQAIDDDISNIISAQLMFLDSVDSERHIELYCSSPGGSVTSGNEILDMMDYIKAPVATTNLSVCASMAAVILANGSIRRSLPRARVMIHQVSAGFQGDYTEMSIQLEETTKLRKDLYDTLAKRTKKTFEEIEIACERDNWFSAIQAKEFGLIDEIIRTRR